MGKALGDRVVDDVGGAFTVGLAYMGDKLGLFAALAEAPRSTSVEVAQRTGLDERYVREWLNGMVASGYVEHDPVARAYFLDAEQKAAFVDEGGRTFVAGAFQLALPSLLLVPELLEVFRRGGGIPFQELSPEIPTAIDRMHRPWFDHLLVQEWLPAAPGVIAALAGGITVLDVGCGQGRSTLALARAYPKSRFLGIDPHAPSLDRGRAAARQQALGNVEFAPVTVESLAAGDGIGTTVRAGTYDLAIAIDCIHDMVRPVEGLRAIRTLLAPGGRLFWSEPTGSHEPLENRNPQGRLRASLSPFHCLTVSLAEGGAGLGTIIGEAGARALAAQAGFTAFQKLASQSATQQFFLLVRASEPTGVG
jgi:2-polyprenyl-3-methyl-5-hydroxy-6-metoxy-1,4-benzoquinol methylase